MQLLVRVSYAGNLRLLVNPIFEIVLAFYDCILTLPDELSLVWRRKWTGSTWLFVANRIFMLALAVYNIVPAIPQVSIAIIQKTLI